MYKLKVEFKDKDKVKELGAKWNREEKCWQIPNLASWRKFRPWLNAEQIQAIEAHQSHLKAQKVVKLQNSAKLMNMLDPFIDDSLDDF